MLDTLPVRTMPGCCAFPTLGGANHAATFHPERVPPPVRGSMLPRGVRRCVGAFRRPCVILTDAILCPTCWAVIEGMTPEQRDYIANGPRLTPAGWEASRG